MLGNLIGRTIRLDYHTLNLDRAKFARLAIEVDLSKQLVPRIWLDDAWQKVEYENLPEVCFDCGRIGHSPDLCSLKKPVTPPAICATVGGDTQAGAVEQMAEEPHPGFGPWMLVTRKNRRNQRDPASIRNGKLEGNHGHNPGGNKAILGKSGTPPKERVSSSDHPTPSTFGTQQRSPNQERKAVTGRKGGEESKKGKEKMSQDLNGHSNGQGKGLLGSGPTKQQSVKNGPKPNSDPNLASTSAQPSEKIDDMSKLISTLLLPAPPAVQTLTGPNGTVMQIVKPQSGPLTNLADVAASSPSVASRTKRNKKHKADQRRSPTKLNPTKSLQIWSPKKGPPRSKRRPHQERGKRRSLGRIPR
ncbi:unnamed protein product [Linum tenue]|uniref:CCHC-type domain-containing protein n=1 Tax=Linum tenue TaxID=586396 RepID=A0AAV0H536_9ROSI|nr:unnamed protein product [Linum tenue]